MSKIKKSILFLGRDKDIYSKKFIFVLKKNYEKVETYLNKNPKDKPSKKFLKWKGDIIICFRSYYILNSKMIKNARICAINFHPGPPKYRGIGCVNFALLKKEKKYGSTVHLINKRVDNGEILDVNYFIINQKDSIHSVLERTYKFQVLQLKKIIKKLDNCEYKVKKLFTRFRWSKKLYLRKNLEKLYNVDPNISKKKIETLLKATNTENFKPYINLHGYKFKFIDEK